MKAVVARKVELASPKNGDPFHIYTDASGYQLGAVSTQHGRPLAFWSKKCTGSQRNYLANRLVLLSILLIFREYRVMHLDQELHIHRQPQFDVGDIQQHSDDEVALRGRVVRTSHSLYQRRNDVANSLFRLPGKSCSGLGKDEVAVHESVTASDDPVLFSLSLQ
ncbi:hypothetical protein P3T76_011702 [Phytophthora citrophthora]|uniref:Reverse transcriptase/retrotransposon-derived protein RNase H-like domain-containing protein n=1 Tax=Phytophthora citrophthora TaxID=4793 RepID=A0AAD9G8T3_9STRA|nr:hypothetical protein P3T76_011702 [Phytophthora citrophthora]